MFFLHLLKYISISYIMSLSKELSIISTKPDTETTAPTGFPTFSANRQLIFDKIQNMTYLQITDLFKIYSNKYNQEFFRLDKNQYVSILLNMPANQHIIIAKEMTSGNIVGLCTLLVESSFVYQGKCVGHIIDLIVDKNARRKGYGTAILRQIEQLAKKENCKLLRVRVETGIASFFCKSNNMHLQKDGDLMEMNL